MTGPPTPTAYFVALGITALYGIISLAGGIIGYVRADSVASLVAGGISGVLLLLCAAGIFYLPAVSLSGAIIIAVALLGRFVPSLLQQRDKLGESLHTMKGTVALLMVIGGVLVILFSAWALATRSSPPGAP
jgi:uncharacterized membrane protein (UPF0136 family)